ncbi:MAG TPA: hypothetical protein VN034_06835 [Sphingopyxis sp.]|nr:hypothetical protein [Sphingopyxis sp.]
MIFDNVRHADAIALAARGRAPFLAVKPSPHAPEKITGLPDGCEIVTSPVHSNAKKGGRNEIYDRSMPSRQVFSLRALRPLGPEASVIRFSNWIAP